MNTLLENTIKNKAYNLEKNQWKTAESSIKSKLSGLDKSQLAKIKAVMQAKQEAQKFQFSSIHQQFEQQAAKVPDNIAISYENSTLTYGELNQRANQLARKLTEQNIRQGDLVVITLSRGIELIISILASLKCGAAYVPVDPVSPPQRIKLILEDAKPQAVITQQQHMMLFEQDSSLTILDLNDKNFKTQVAQYSTNNNDELNQQLTHGDLAYIIYTSGSTGVPKGVMVEHGNVGRLFSATSQQFDFNQSDVWTLFHSYAFDFSVWEIWGALFNGGKLVLVPYDVSRNPAEFEQLLVDEQVTVLNQTPSAFSNLQRQILAGQQGLNLRYVIFGGEALDPKALALWFERFGDDQPQLINMYGITETTVHVTYKRIKQGDINEGLSNIGQLIGDLNAVVLNDKMKKVPDGVVGELYISGAGVTRGYLNSPELTNERFISRSFNQKPLSRWYKTGDLVRYLTGGELEYIGRADNQVKLRGFRIELGEIDRRLVDYEQVADAICAIKGEGEEKKIIAYVVVNTTANEHWKSGLLSHLMHFLPDYMVPSAVVSLTELPLTVNGKIDTQALPLAQPEDFWQAGYLAPENAIQSRLCELFADLFALETVGIADNFFALGGDSLKTVNLVAHAAEQGLHFTVSDIFTCPTIAQLSEKVSVMDKSENQNDKVGPFELISAEDVAKLPVGIEAAYPMSRLQQGMVFHNLASEDNSLFHNVINQHFVGEFDFEVFDKAFAKVISRHDILRTSLHLEGYEVPMQLVHKTVKSPLQVFDLTALDHQAQQKTLDAALIKYREERFDLVSAPLLKCVVYQLSDTSFELIWLEHHAILDGWSLASMVTQLTVEYAGLLKGDSLEVDIPEGYYREFIKSELDALASEEQQHFWKNYIGDADLTRIGRVAKQPNQDFSIKPLVSEIIPPTLFARCKALSQQLNVPCKTVFLAAYAKTVSVFGSTEDVIAGLSSHGRPDNTDASLLLGLYVHTKPFRINVANQNWKGLIERCFEQEQELWQTRHFPLAEIQSKAGDQDLFEIGFTFNNFFISEQASDMGIKGTRESDAYEFNSFPMDFACLVNNMDDNICELRLTYDKSLFDHHYASKVHSYFLLALENMVTNVNAPAAIISDSDQILLKTLGQGEVTLPIPQTPFIRQFEQQALLNPEDSAVVFSNEELSYCDLNERSNCLAAYLVAQGIGRGDIVIMALERSLEMLIAILGIMKTGAAYLPITSGTTIERSSKIIVDSGCQHLLLDNKMSEVIDSTSLKVLSMDNAAKDKQWLSEYSADNLELPIEAGDIAYLIYTSGSTGTPKGVPVTQHNLVNQAVVLAAELEKVSVKGRFNWGWNAPLSFDASISGLTCLTSGVCLHILSEDERRDPQLMLDFVAEHQIDIMDITPSMLEVLVEQSTTPAQQLPGLIIGGEEISDRLWHQLGDTVRINGKPAINIYGPTETTVNVTFAHIKDYTSTTIGLPTSNSELYICDAQGQLVPPGIAGELYIGGDSVTKGYLNDPEKSATQFVDIKVNGQLKSVYRSGDRVRWAADGTIDYLGRIDNQVKIRGIRIETGEISAVIKDSAQVQDCVVRAVKSDSGQTTLAAYVIPIGNFDEAQLRDLAKAKLPDYMQPASWLALTEWPLTSSGKLNYNELPKVSELHKADLVLPRTQTEQQLLDIWQTLIGISQISITDDFFSVGGHSLLLTRLLLRVRETFNCQIQLADLVKYRTISDMAELITASFYTLQESWIEDDRASEEMVF
jgi:amino acid adenylation domain-containing protein